MKKTPAWRRYLRFWRSDIAGDVEDELRFHVEMRVNEYITRGMTEDEARRAVAARLGDLEAARAECVALGAVRERHARNADFLDGLRADVRFALRGLAHSPGWTAVALLTIALGVGATTTVFSVADALLVRPLTYRDASQVYVARRELVLAGGDAPVDAIPMAAVFAWREHARTIEGLAAFSASRGTFGTGADAPEVSAGIVDVRFLPFTGARPLIGRNFTAEELTPDGPGPMLLSEGFWRRYYGGSPDALGKTVDVGGRLRTIVGVVPATVAFPNLNVPRPDVWVPLNPLGTQRVPSVVVRLKPGVSREAATQELQTIFNSLNVPLPRFGKVVPQVTLSRPQEKLRFRSALTMLTGAVALLLLVACTNIAHLLLARGAARQRELAVRHALGAERSRLLRQLVTESVVLATLGGALAVSSGGPGSACSTRSAPTISRR
jgi:predicted permease